MTYCFSKQISVRILTYVPAKNVLNLFLICNRYLYTFQNHLAIWQIKLSVVSSGIAEILQCTAALHNELPQTLPYSRE